MASHREERGKAGTQPQLSIKPTDPQRQRPHSFPTAAQGEVKDGTPWQNVTRRCHLHPVL